MSDPVRFRADCLAVCCFFAALAFHSTTVLAGEKEYLQSILPGQDTAVLECISEDWAIWRTSELIEETRFERGQKFHHRFYRQRLTEPAAGFAFGEVNSPIGHTAAIRKHMAILPDGTIVRPDGRTVKWHDRSGSTDVSQRVEGSICQVYSDGILVQSGAKALSGPGQARFIPFNGKQLDFENEVEISSPGMKSFKYGEPVRHDYVFAWLMPNEFHFFDLSSGTRSQVSLDDFNNRILRASSFDGATIVVGERFAFDAESGKLLANLARSDHYARILSVRNQIGYSIQDGWLVAIDLMTPKRPAVRLEEVSQKILTEGSKGLTVYTPSGWKVVPWLSSLPADDIE